MNHNMGHSAHAPKVASHNSWKIKLPINSQSFSLRYILDLLHSVLLPEEIFDISMKYVVCSNSMCCVVRVTDASAVERIEALLQTSGL